MGHHLSCLRTAWCIAGTLFAAILHAQTTAGIGTTIVFPVTAQTASFASEMTLFNPGPTSLTASVKFYEANNSATPGLKTCSDVTVAASRSAQIALSSQCTLTAASHFGLLIIADKASPQSHNFYGYMRVQNPQGVGFSVEGFPVENFNNQVSDAIGLMKQAASPGYQTNCFVGSLDQAVSYSVKLFNGFSGSQIGSTVTGSLTAFQQIRYLDIFGASGVNAPAGDQFNVRAEFTQTSGTTANLIGFCTVQDNTSFGADFRVAKSYGSPSGNFFAQGGNAFGATAVLGTTDANPVEVYVGGTRAMRFEPSGDTVNLSASVNIIGGYPGNQVGAGIGGATIAGGGKGGYENVVTGSFGTIGGGYLNNSNGSSSVVAGGYKNSAAKDYAAVAGGQFNSATGIASFVAGGEFNTASGQNSLAAGYEAVAAGLGSFVWADSAGTTFDATNGPGGWGNNRANTFSVRATGGVWFLSGVNASGDPLVGAGVELISGTGAWATYSDRNGKDNIEAVDPRAVLDQIDTIPVATWRWIGEDAGSRHMGPMAQDFYAAFHLGADDRHIVTVDEEGVALAGIQGLHRLVEEKNTQIKADEQELAAQRLELTNQREEIGALKRRVAQIEAMGDQLDALKAAISKTAASVARVAVDARAN